VILVIRAGGPRVPALLFASTKELINSRQNIRDVLLKPGESEMQSRQLRLSPELAFFSDKLP
jgi:hypothetical protein